MVSTVTDSGSIGRPGGETKAHILPKTKTHLRLGEAEVGPDLQLGVALRPVQGQAPPQRHAVLEVQRLDALRPDLI